MAETREIGDSKEFSTNALAYADFVSDTGNNLVGQGIQLFKTFGKVATSNCYDESVVMNASNGDASNYLHWQAQIRNNGVIGAGIKWRNGGNETTTIDMDAGFTKFEGYELTQGPPTTAFVVAFIGADINSGQKIFDCLIHDITGGGNTIAMGLDNADCVAYNNIINNIHSDGASNLTQGLRMRFDRANQIITHNTVYDCGNAGDSATSKCLEVRQGAAGGCVMKNNIGMNPPSSGSRLCFGGASSGDTGDRDYNMSSDASADDIGSGTHHLISKLASNQFTIPGTDFTLLETADAKDAGFDTSGVDGSSSDIKETAWAVPPSMGAEEFVTPAPPATDGDSVVALVRSILGSQLNIDFNSL